MTDFFLTFNDFDDAYAKQNKITERISAVQINGNRTEAVSVHRELEVFQKVY